MQSSVRTTYNHALEYAVRESNKSNKPLLVFFGITPTFPEANLRHFTFMLEGLKDTKKAMLKRNINLILEKIPPDLGALKFANKASTLVTDRGYTRILRKWREKVANKIKCPLIQVESDIIVPVEEASEKEEYAARTIRPKIKKKLDKFLVPLKETKLKDNYGEEFDSLNLSSPKELAKKIKGDQNVGPVSKYRGGQTEAQKHLKIFLDEKLDDYHELRNDPTKNFQSDLSPYLHFGQISPLEIALKVQEADSPGKEAFLEELIIRRELAINYVYYNSKYDSYDGITDWAKKTLREHRDDPREYIYSFNDLELAKTDDPYWNAAQLEMVITGKMHGYMRMYWGKKILEWSKDPVTAFSTALELNNKYELDGRDPNSYTGIAWCFGKHDRPWKERHIFGKTRYMNNRGLERKFDIKKYVEIIKELSKTR
jgi:deoxyribodipyrimidine photo-lyase